MMPTTWNPPFDEWRQCIWSSDNSEIRSLTVTHGHSDVIKVFHCKTLTTALSAARHITFAVCVKISTPCGRLLNFYHHPSAELILVGLPESPDVFHDSIPPALEKIVWPWICRNAIRHTSILTPLSILCRWANSKLHFCKHRVYHLSGVIRNNNYCPPT